MTILKNLFDPSPHIPAGRPMSGRRGSNSPPIAWKAIALPNELLPQFSAPLAGKNKRTYDPSFLSPDSKLACGQRRIRTSVLVREQIYSLSPLATRPSAQVNFPVYWKFRSRRRESNPRPTDYKSVALPTELLRLILKNY